MLTLLRHVNIYSSVVSSSGETDLKGMLRHSLSFSVERRVIFFLLEMRHVRIIFHVNLLLNDASRANLHTKNLSNIHRRQGKNPRKSDYQVFSICLRNSNI